MTQVSTLKKQERNIADTQDAEEALLTGMAMNGPGLNAIIRTGDLKLYFVNDAFEYYFGYSNADLKNGNVLFSEMLENYQLDRFLYQLGVSAESIEGRSRYVIYRLKNKKGETAFYNLYAAPLPENMAGIYAGEQLFQLVLHPDLSQWDVPFTSFITSELFFEQFNSEDFGTFEWIIKADRYFWSVGLYKIYEIDDTHMAIDSAREHTFIHPEDRERVTDEVNGSLSSGTNLDTNYRIVTAKQNVKTIHCLARPIKNKDGVLVKFAGSVRDITIQQAIEASLKNKVEQLNQSNKELEEFAYVASHDMQEPLRKISIFSDRLNEKYKDVLTGDGAMYLSRMRTAADNMRALIEALLDFSRVSKTLQPFEQVDLNKTLQQVKTELELVIEETSTKIKSEPLPTLEAVSSQMKQLLANIIGNAIKFHRTGVPPEITIESELMQPSDKMNFDLVKGMPYYRITITDNGVGFEEEYATRIFQVFQRLHGKSEYPGSGIGLAICKKILEYHNGIIYAESVPDAGSRFTFILPQTQPYKEPNA